MSLLGLTWDDIAVVEFATVDSSYLLNYIFVNFIIVDEAVG